MSTTFERVATHAMLIVFAIIAVYPLVSIVALALTPSDEIITGFAIPTNPTLDNFSTAWDGARFEEALLNSATVAVVVVVVSVALSVLSGYALGTMRFPGSTLLFFILMTGLDHPVRVARSSRSTRCSGAGTSSTACRR